MTNIAQQTIDTLRHKFAKNRHYNMSYTAIDNSELHDDLNDASVSVKDILTQETWVMSDGSYITRNDDAYWTGDNIDDFECVEYESEQNGYII